MIIGVIADVHGNIYGLERIIDLLERSNAEKIFFLGDAVNYFGKGKDVLTFLREKNIPCTKGNHEIMLLNNVELTAKQREIYGIDFTRESIGKEDYAYIASWSDIIEFSSNGAEILMVHGSPFDHYWGYIYPDNTLEAFNNLPYDIVFMGHTHVPFVREIQGRLIVNVGSAGLPRDDGRYISCALFNTKEREVRILRDRFPSEKLRDLKPFSSEVLTVLGRRIGI